jgi:putative ABC transport system permease protein
MNLFAVAFRNLMRNKVRSGLTIVGLALAVVVFVLMQTLLTSWGTKISFASRDRVTTWHKVSLGLYVPVRYAEEIRNIPGVKATTYGVWFGGRYPQDPNYFFSSYAAQMETQLAVYDELSVTPEQFKALLDDPQGAAIGDQLSKRMGWKVGDRVTLVSSLYPGDWTFNIRAVYRLTRKTFDRTGFIIHYKYLNARTGPPLKDHVGYITSKVTGDSAPVIKRIDGHFANRDIQTQTASELAFNLSFLHMVSSFLTAIDAISIIILVIMMLILANTISMGVRERTNEYGMLRAVGFSPWAVGRMIIGEAMVIGFFGGVLGLAMSVPLIERGIGPWLAQNMGFFFSHVWVAQSTAIKAVAICVLVGPAAALLPTYNVSKINVIEALRKVG